MKLRYPQMKDEYDYIIENILTDDREDNDWYDEYIDYLLDNMLCDIEKIKSYKYRSEKIQKLLNRIDDKV